MGSERATHTIQELIDAGIITAHKDGNYGSMYPRQSEFGDTGVLFLTAKLVSDQGSIDFKNAPRLNSEKAEKLTFGYIESKDVLLSHNATVGRVALTPELTEPVLVGTSLTYFRTDSSRLLPEYFAAYLSGVDFQNELRAVMGLSTRNQVPITTQRKLKVVIPPLPEQKAIAHILGTLDEKIELNRRMNATLEGMAQALFKSWFVDFDPVIDNALAAGNPIPDELAPRAEVRRQALADGTANREAAEAFPAAFQETEAMGWIPEGWEVKPLESIIKLIGGGTPKTSIEEYWNGEIPWFSVVDAPNDSDVFVIDTEKMITSEAVANSSTKVLRAGTTIISARGTVGRCALVGRDMAMNQSCYGIQGADDIGDIFTYYTVREYVADLQQRGHGSVFNTITRDTFKTIAVPFCGKELTHHFDKVVSPQLDRISSNLSQLKSLTKLRDTLLPKLISGELRIPDAEQLTEEALT